MNVMILLPIGLFAIMLIIVFCFSSRGRNGLMNNMMKNNLDMLKNMHTGEMGETLKDLSKTAINIKKDILEENEDALKEVAEMEANIEKGAIKIKAEAVKEGFSNDSYVSDKFNTFGTKTMFCKHCGAKIDKDSKFCKECGKAQ